MSNSIPHEETAASCSASGMRSEIVQKWNKLSATDIAALKTNEDLIAQVQSKYGLDRAKAQSEVETFAKGRVL